MQRESFADTFFHFSFFNLRLPSFRGNYSAKHSFKNTVRLFITAIRCKIIRKNMCTSCDRKSLTTRNKKRKHPVTNNGCHWLKKILPRIMIIDNGKIILSHRCNGYRQPKQNSVTDNGYWGPKQNSVTDNVYRRPKQNSVTNNDCYWRSKIKNFPTDNNYWQ